MPVVPKRLAKLITTLSNRYIWWATLSPDAVERRYISDSDVQGDWDQVGVVPTEIEDNAITYLRRYRSAYVRFWLALCVSLTYSLTGAIQGELHPSSRATSFARGPGKCRPIVYTRRSDRASIPAQYAVGVLIDSPRPAHLYVAVSQTNMQSSVCGSADRS